MKIVAGVKSSITTINFDSSGLVVLTGDTAGKIKILSCFIEDVDQGKSFEG